MLYIYLFGYLVFADELNKTIYNSIKYLSDKTNLNIMRNNIFNDICVRFDEISNLLKEQYGGYNERYICLFDKSMGVLINENGDYKEWFNLNDYISYEGERNYRDLTIYRKENKTINVIISFVQNKNINFVLCQNNLENNNIINISNYSYSSSVDSFLKGISCHIIDAGVHKNKLICFYSKLSSYNEFYLLASIFDQEKDFILMGNLSEYKHQSGDGNVDTYIHSSIINNKNLYFLCMSIHNDIFCFIYNNTDYKFYYNWEIHYGLQFAQTYFFKENQNIKIVARNYNKNVFIFSIKNNWTTSGYKEEECSNENEVVFNDYFFLSYNNSTNNYNLTSDLDKKFDCNSVIDTHLEIPNFNDSSANSISSTTSDSKDTSDSANDSNLITEHINPSSSIISITNFISNDFSDSTTNINVQNSFLISTIIINPTTQIAITILDSKFPSPSSSYPIIETTLPNDIIRVEKLNITKYYG